MDADKVPLISNSPERGLRRKNTTRLAISCYLCLVTLADVAFIVFCLCSKGVGSNFDLIRVVCAFYVALTIATVGVGLYGIFMGKYLALRCFITLFTMVNALIILVSSTLFVFFLRYRDFFDQHHAPRVLVYLDAHRALGITVFVVNLVVRLVNAFLVWFCGELEATFELVLRQKAAKQGAEEAAADGDQFSIEVKDDFE